MGKPNSEHLFNNSSYIEKTVEHQFIYGLLNCAFRDFNKMLEVSRPDVDNSGFDLIIECNNILRHVQLKTSSISSKTRSQKIHNNLSKKKSGCVIWMLRDKDNVGFEYLFFGNTKGKSLPSLSRYKNAKQSKSNKSGTKNIRSDIKVVPRTKFKLISSDSVSREHKLLNILFDLK